MNHFPLVREPTRVLRYPEFAQWCGTTRTADWHMRFNAAAVVYGHLHIPRTTWHDGVRFEEVSLGYPREWRRRGGPVAGRAAADPAGPGERVAVIGEILPPEVAVRRGVRRTCRDVVLFPGEEAVIAKAVDKRRREFTTARACARAALAQAGRAARADPARCAGRAAVAAGRGRAASRTAPGTGRPPWPVTGRAHDRPGRRAATTSCPMGCSDAVALPGERAGLAALAAAGPGAVLGPAAVQRQGVGVQGVVPADPALAGLRGRGHHDRSG